MNLPPGPFKIIYADPPWSFNNKNTGGSMTSGAANQYDVMTIDDICALPVKDIADQDCVLAMWWVASQPIEALKVVDAWGFKLKTMTGFNWEKITKHGSPFFGMGYWTRAGSECCLIATKGKAKPASRSVRSVERAVVEKHSKKPDVFRYKLEMLCGDVPRIELFARQEYDGWSAWGNEL